MEHDAWFFVGIFAFIFLVWLATGGPLHPIAFQGPTLAAPAELGGGTYLSFPRATFGLGQGTTISLPGSSDGGSTLEGSSANTTSAPSVGISGVTFGPISPYRNIVSLDHYVSSAGTNDEHLSLSISSSADIPVDLSGWTLESEATGNSTLIPQGTETPTSGIVNAAQDIVLKPGERAVIISGQSPIGASFKENKCIGYYSTFQTFSPSLPQNCPTPANELSSFYGPDYVRDASCITYVNTLSRCQVVLTPPTTLSGNCQTFLVKYLNYNGCLAAHQGDSDFSGDTWHIYLGRTNALWRTSHEVVKLLDKDGKTVDAFSY